MIREEVNQGASFRYNRIISQKPIKVNSFLKKRHFVFFVYKKEKQSRICSFWYGSVWFSAFQLSSQKSSGGEDQLGLYLAAGDLSAWLIGMIRDRRNASHNIPFADDGHGAADEKASAFCQNGDGGRSVAVKIERAVFDHAFQFLGKRFVGVFLSGNA